MAEIQLHHIGELIVAKLLSELKKQTQEIPCVLCTSGCSVKRVLTLGRVTGPYRFKPNVALRNDGELRFDGEHRIDVLATGTGSFGLAMEVKLGFGRLALKEFEKRFLAPLSGTSHRPERIKGNMIAILKSRFHKQEFRLRAAGEPAVEIAPEWVLILRRNVWHKWKKENKARATLGEHAHVVLLEELVKLHGDGAKFDELVRTAIGTNFFSDWKLGDDSP